MEDVEEEQDDVGIEERSLCPLTDHGEVLSIALQQDAIQKQSRRMSCEQKQLKGLDAV